MTIGTATQLGATGRADAYLSCPTAAAQICGLRFGDSRDATRRRSLRRSPGRGGAPEVGGGHRPSAIRPRLARPGRGQPEDWRAPGHLGAGREVARHTAPRALRGGQPHRAGPHRAGRRGPSEYGGMNVPFHCTVNGWACWRAIRSFQHRTSHCEASDVDRTLGRQPLPRLLRFHGTRPAFRYVGQPESAAYRTGRAYSSYTQNDY